GGTGAVAAPGGTGGTGGTGAIVMFASSPTRKTWTRTSSRVPGSPSESTVRIVVTRLPSEVVSVVVEVFARSLRSTRTCGACAVSRRGTAIASLLPGISVYDIAPTGSEI